MQPGTDPVSRFALQVFWLNGLLLRNGERLTRVLGQSSARWQVLGRAGAAPQTVAAMARDLGQARQSVQRVADSLAVDGLVAFLPLPTDRRTQLVTLTDDGRAALRAIYEQNQLWTDRILSSLGAERLEAVRLPLDEIGRALEEDLAWHTSLKL